MENRMEGTLRAFSHDMRAPLENVIALVTLSLERLKEEARGGAESVVPYLRKILVAARDMEMMTDDLLTQEGESREGRFTAQELAESVSAAVGEQAAQRRQLLHIDVSGLGEAAMIGDGAALKRILTNLMSNAVKYTQDEGRISLIARGERTGCGAMEAEFIVEDNGMGMDAAFMARMYEPLARSRQALDSAIPGHGLGLASVKRLTERMHAAIDAQSEPGRGTRFTLRVPLGVEETQAEEQGEELAGKRILLAEDNDLSAEIAQAILEGKGASVRRAADGEQAVKLFASLPAGTFDAILLDMRMPVLGGCGAAGAIRAMARADARRIPILALTAGGDAQDEREAIAAGMNGCLKKPLDVQALRLAIK